MFPYNENNFKNSLIRGTPMDKRNLILLKKSYEYHSSSVEKKILATKSEDIFFTTKNFDLLALI